MTGFISTHWHITSHGMFAGSCIGVICLVIMLEFLRRLSKDYDRYIVRQFQRQTASEASYARAHKATAVSACCGSNNSENNNNNKNGPLLSPSEGHGNIDDNATRRACYPSSSATGVTLRFRPTFIQQSIRALLHMVTFAVAYFIMLLAMYYNGYFIICIFVGAYLGAFIFTWESVSVG
jgi:copper transporter 1